MAQGRPLQLCQQVLFNNYGNFFFENNMALTQDYKGQDVKAKQILVLHLVCIGIYCIYTIEMSIYCIEHDGSTLHGRLDI